jgi:hypothetical protein
MFLGDLQHAEQHRDLYCQRVELQLAVNRRDREKIA